MREQISFQDIFEQMIPTIELPNHIGERVHFLVKPVECLDPNNARDEWCTIEESYREQECFYGRFVYVKFRRDDGYYWTSHINIKSDSHCYAEVDV